MCRIQWNKIAQRVLWRCVAIPGLLMAVLCSSCLPRAESVQCQGTQLRCPAGFACAADQETCIKTNCGNNKLDLGEECDDGNLINGDACDSNCTLPKCGNGIVANDEECDDGNRINGDGCDTDCTATRCGNGITTKNEECDDGNRINGDGCDSNCTMPKCGNNIMTRGEECDDGNLIDGDGCDSNCTTTECGNGIHTPPDEKCDQGSANSNNGECLKNCQMASCGDGYVRSEGEREKCDDGNQNECGTCDKACQIPRTRARGFVVINVDSSNLLTSNDGFGVYNLAVPVPMLIVAFVYKIDAPSTTSTEISIPSNEAGNSIFIAQETVRVVNGSVSMITANLLDSISPIIEIRAKQFGMNGNLMLTRMPLATHLVASGMTGGTGDDGELCPPRMGCKSGADCMSNRCQDGQCE